jgi:hypothetical protein
MPKAPARPPRQRPPLGVYVSDHRESALAIRRTEHGIWFLTLRTGKVTIEFYGDERFLHDFPLVLPDYPIRRAIRKYDQSGLSRDEKTQKVLTRLLENL